MSMIDSFQIRGRSYTVMYNFEPDVGTHPGLNSHHAQLSNKNGDRSMFPSAVARNGQADEFSAVMSNRCKGLTVAAGCEYRFDCRLNMSDVSPEIIAVS